MGGIAPYYRRRRPQPQSERDYLRDFSLCWIIARLRAQKFPLPPAPIGLRALATTPYFPRDNPSSGIISVRELLGKMLGKGGVLPYVNLIPARPATPERETTLAEADALRDRRAAAAVFAAVAPELGIRVFPVIRWQVLRVGPVSFNLPYGVDDATGQVKPKPNDGLFSNRDLLEMKFYGDLAPTVYHPTSKTLACMAYDDYFPGARSPVLHALVAQALRGAAPGWCGTFGPGVGTFKIAFGTPTEGNYDMTQQHLLRIAYAYFDKLPADARELLITELLARGRIARVNLDDTFTSGRVPNDWARAGKVNPIGIHKRIGETENHIMTIATARYLTNQLLYQRTRSDDFDNRRNRSDDASSCMDQILYLLWNILRDDFSEYNAKSYQHETRTALLNLASFAYDGEVTLAARMVLDYISAHMATSSSDCRRLVPFRRRNEGKNVTRGPDGSMAVSLVDGQAGSDPMTEHMAEQTGALRAFSVAAEPFRPLDWSIAADGGDTGSEGLSDYRMPPAIADLFLSDTHRRFFQVMYRRSLDDTDITARNSDTGEINAGSPSYLITAGGMPAPYAIDPYFLFILPSGQDQQLGVALPSSFMPTGGSATNMRAVDGTITVPGGLQSWAADAIQVGRFAQNGYNLNYGVVPDLLFGPFLHLPDWCKQAIRFENRIGRFDFVDKRGPDGMPGFYLAILRDGDLAIVEAFDTWLHPDRDFHAFRHSVWQSNQGLSNIGLPQAQDLTYVTQAGHRVKLTMFADEDRSAAYGLDIQYADNAPNDRLPDLTADDPFLRGTIMNGPGDGFVRIDNPFLGQWLELDLRDRFHPRRRAEDGSIQSAGNGEDIWIDFDWAASGGAQPGEGDFYRPFSTLADGRAALADGGTLHVMPGATAERGALGLGKRMRITAPIGGVRIGGTT